MFLVDLRVLDWLCHCLNGSAVCSNCWTERENASCNDNVRDEDFSPVNSYPLRVKLHLLQLKTSGFFLP